MPGMDGLDFIRVVRANPNLADVPVVMLTTEGDRAVRQSAIDAGATDFLTKPVDPIELKMRLRNLLTMRKAMLAHDVEDLLGGIRQAAARGDVAAIRLAAHTLRGASASLGYSEIARACDLLRDVFRGPGPLRPLPDAVAALTKACAGITSHEKEQTVLAVA